MSPATVFTASVSADIPEYYETTGKKTVK